MLRNTKEAQNNPVRMTTRKGRIAIWKNFENDGMRTADPRPCEKFVVHRADPVADRVGHWLAHVRLIETSGGNPFISTALPMKIRFVDWMSG